MRTLLVAAIFCPLVAGCGFNPKQKPVSESNQAQSAAKPDSSAAGAGFGAVQQVRGAANRIVNAAELKGLHLYIENYSISAGAMPNRETIYAALQQEDRKCAELVKDGTLILTGSTVRESVWAYEKNAPTAGGWVVSHNGVERVDAATFNRMLTGR